MKKNFPLLKIFTFTFVPFVPIEPAPTSERRFLRLAWAFSCAGALLPDDPAADWKLTDDPKGSYDKGHVHRWITNRCVFHQNIPECGYWMSKRERKSKILQGCWQSLKWPHNTWRIYFQFKLNVNKFLYVPLINDAGYTKNWLIMNDSITVPITAESISPKQSPASPTLSSNSGSRIEALKLRFGSKMKIV